MTNHISSCIKTDSVGRLSIALGSTEFGYELARLMDARIGAEHIMCLAYTEREGLQCLLNSGSVRGQWGQSLKDLYMQKYFRLDPNLEIVITPRQLRQPSVLAFDRQRLPSAQYRSVFWSRSPFSDKCSLVFSDGAISLYCNFYRTTARTAFNDDDRQQVYALGGMVSGMLMAHFRLLAVSACPLAPEMPAPPAPDVPELSAREKVVLSLVLVGQTNEAMALDQGVSINTIKTYRKRLYRKLGVSTLNELHARYGRSTDVLKPRESGAAGRYLLNA